MLPKSLEAERKNRADGGTANARRSAALDDSPIPPLEPSRGAADAGTTGPRRAGGSTGAGTTPPTASDKARIAPDAAERPVPREITGLVTEEGQSCPTLRGPDGTLYALVGEVPALAPGTIVTVEAVEVDGAGRCSAGRTVAVGAFRVRAVR